MKRNRPFGQPKASVRLFSFHSPRVLAAYEAGDMAKRAAWAADVRRSTASIVRMIEADNRQTKAALARAVAAYAPKAEPQP